MRLTLKRMAKPDKINLDKGGANKAEIYAINQDYSADQQIEIGLQIVL